jgi:hypothetical protein
LTKSCAPELSPEYFDGASAVDFESDDLPAVVVSVVFVPFSVVTVEHPLKLKRISKPQTSGQMIDVVRFFTARFPFKGSFSYRDFKRQARDNAPPLYNN